MSSQRTNCCLILGNVCDWYALIWSISLHEGGSIWLGLACSRIDNRCSACISPDPLDFIGTFKSTNRTITGFGGTQVQSLQKRTIRWYWEDDTGQVHRFDIPNSYYVPNAKADRHRDVKRKIIILRFYVTAFSTNGTMDVKCKT